MKSDGSPIRVTQLFDGRVFVDIEPYNDTRGGPEYPQHHHRFEEYGLSDGLQRCRKCGLVTDGVQP